MSDFKDKAREHEHAFEERGEEFAERERSLFKRLSEKTRIPVRLLQFLTVVALCAVLATIVRVVADG